MSSKSETETTQIRSSGEVSLVGSTIGGRYHIEKELTRGGFGIVYLAHDLQLHSRPVVIKVLLEEANKSSYVVQKFHQEIEALSRIDHPGVVGIIDTGTLSDGKAFIVMQYVDGMTLRSVMTLEGMELNKVAEIIRQIGRALTAAHEKGIFHRDLKPENVMLQNLGDGEQQVKVIDFGIAKIKDSLVQPETGTGIAVGTIAYMAPEQLTNQAVSAATDVYALGEIAYEMLTGQKPFNPQTAFELLGLQAEGVKINPVDLRPGLPADAQAVILKTLTYDPSKRYAKAKDFGDDLARALTAGPVTSPSLPRETAEPAPTQLVGGLAPLVQRASGGAQTVAATFPTIDRPLSTNVASAPVDKQTGWFAKTIVVVVGVLLVSALLLGAVYLFRSRSATAPEDHAATTERTLSYWLNVQKMRNGRTYENEFASSGQEIFENGWKFKMNMASQQFGYLYLINEGPSGSGGPTFNILFPAPSSNSGSAYIAANQNVTTGWMVFDENQGTEKFWLVWSASPVPELEAVRDALNEKSKGTIEDANKSKAVRDFLTSRYSSSKLVVEKDKTKKQTNVKSQGDVAVSFVELEHH